MTYPNRSVGVGFLLHHLHEGLLTLQTKTKRKRRRGENVTSMGIKT